MVKIHRSALASAATLLALSVSALAQQVTGVPGAPGATTTITGKQLPPLPSEIRRGHQGEGYGVDAMVGPARRAAEGRA